MIGPFCQTEEASMAWIRVIGEDEADDELRAAFERVKGKRGKLSNIMAVHSLRPEAMTAHMDLYLATMFSRSDLSREEREMIAVVVSTSNRCPYCIRHHAEALGHYWRDPERLARFVEDREAVDVGPKMTVALEYAQKLTETPENVIEEDIESLRTAGFSDEDILSIALIVAYFNFVNRIVLGLGVEATEDEISGYQV